MPPSAVVAEVPMEAGSYDQIQALKARLATEKAVKPVADNFMYDFKYPTNLPVIGGGVAIDFGKDFDAAKAARDFHDTLFAALQCKNGETLAELFLQEGVWRDRVAITWEYRTFNTAAKIRDAANDLLPRTPFTRSHVIDPAPTIDRPYPDLAYLQFSFAFDTHKTGGSAVVNIINTTRGLKIWTLNTAIESLHGFPELPNRDGHMTGPVSWAAQRELDHEFDTHQPEVVIVGGGHNGLMMAARFKALGVPALIVERNARIGDNWRNRYEALSLHFPHWADHFPYMPYPEHWPVYTPAGKLGDWLEWYASALELYSWTNSGVTSCAQNPDGSWVLKVNRNGIERILTPKHVVIATSLAGIPSMPHVPGVETFTGTVRHSTEHDSSRAWVGQKVMVVGTSSSGFDTAYDFARRGIDVTILQRSPTYIMSLDHSVPKFLGSYKPDEQTGKRPDLDVVDRMSYSMPVGPAEDLGRRAARALAELDKPIITAMEARGFRTWIGQRGTGVQTLGYTKNGGFYFDAGACAKIIDGSIKVEQGYITRFDGEKVILNGERVQHYNLVVMATGFSNTIDSVRKIVGEDIASRLKPIWGMDEEGELNSAWKDCGVPNLWLQVGTLQHGRYHSKRLALRIKAMLEGVAEAPYTS